MSGLRPLRDTDTVTFELDGDSLTLRNAPRQREVEASNEIEQKAAFKAMAAIKDAGIDVDKFTADASEEDVDKAKEASRPAAEVREYRLKALAVSMTIDGLKVGGEAIVETYHDMPPVASDWVDARVAEVWDGAIPGEGDTRGSGADAGVPESAAYGTT